MIFTSSKFLGIAAAVLLAVSGTQADFLDKPSIATYWGQVSILCFNQWKKHC
jgi:hypothetical protein